jgi:hypothetical protein
LQDAEQDQHPEAWRGATQPRAESKQEDAQQEEALSPEQTRQPSADGKIDGIRNEVRREHPGTLIVAGPQVARHVRQRDVGDAGVQHFHECAMATTTAMAED